jgi:DNA helicase TIP49 (TBP-interacting protein)
METDTEYVAPVATPEQVASAEEAMRAAGVATEEVAYDDYFGFAESEQVFLPDGRQYVEITVLNEGKKKNYQNTVNRDVVIQKATGDAKMKMAQGDERHALLKAAITGWHLVQRNKDTGEFREIGFSNTNLNKFLDSAPPRVIELIEKAIRKANPWLMADLSLEDIDKEIANLQELRQKKVEEEEGKGI